MRKWLGITISIAFGFGLALLLADAGIRIANRWFPYFYCYDQYRGWGLNPGAAGWYRREGTSYLRINRDGFRGPDYSQQKPPDTVRIAVLGDSYVEAMQVPEDETFVAVIQRELAECPLLRGRQVQVMNFGVDGYGTAQELMTLRRKVWKYSSDMVVLALFLGNDIRNNSVVLEGDQCRPFYNETDGELVPTGPFLSSPSFKLWCMARFDYRDLRLLDLFTNAWEIITTRNRTPTPQQPLERAINYNIYKPPADKAWRDAWNVTEALILATRDDVRNHGAAFLAITEDTGIQVWPDPTVPGNFAKRLGVKDLFYPDRRIAALGERQNFEVLTLAQPLQQYAETNHVYLHGFKNTPMGFGHWNKTGHAIAGKLIAEKICKMIEAREYKTCVAADVMAGTTGGVR
jgi:hypothetical protein